MIDTVLAPFEWAVSWTMIRLHQLLALAGMSPDSGLTWTLSIVGLVVLLRMALVPLAVRQLRAQRALQVLRPRVTAIQRQHQGNRQRQSEELRRLYQETGTSPFAGFLPMLLQAPVFLALFRVLRGIATGTPLGDFTAQPAALLRGAGAARLAGAPLGATFWGSHLTAVHLVAAALVVLMSAAVIVGHHWQLRGTPATGQQRAPGYVSPLIFLLTGGHLPVGVLVYWCATNLWSTAQLMVLTPAPADPALVRGRAGG